MSSRNRNAHVFDRGCGVVDATLVAHDGRRCFAAEDDRGENRSGTRFKPLRVRSVPIATGKVRSVSELVTPK